MRLALLLLLSALTAIPAEDAWTRVRDLKSGTDLRIFRARSKEPLEAKFERASDDSLVVLTKSQELSLVKDDIERIDSRRADAGRIMKGTRTERKVVAPGAEVSRNTIPGVTTTVSTGLNIPTKPGFETVYQRPAPQK